MNMIYEFFEVFFWYKYLTSREKSWNTRKIASESLQKIRTKLWGCRTCVGRVKTVVTNHLRIKYFEVIHKAAERNIAARTNSDKLTKTNS